MSKQNIVRILEETGWNYRYRWETYRVHGGDGYAVPV